MRIHLIPALLTSPPHPQPSSHPHLPLTPTLPPHRDFPSPLHSVRHRLPRRRAGHGGLRGRRVSHALSLSLRMDLGRVLLGGGIATPPPNVKSTCCSASYPSPSYTSEQQSRFGIDAIGNRKLVRGRDVDSINETLLALLIQNMLSSPTTTRIASRHHHTIAPTRPTIASNRLKPTSPSVWLGTAFRGEVADAHERRSNSTWRWRMSVSLCLCVAVSVCVHAVWVCE